MSHLIHDDNSMTGLNRCSFCSATVGHTNECPARPGEVVQKESRVSSATGGSDTRLNQPLESLPPLSLHQIESGLMQLLEAREEVEAEGLAPDELKPFDDEIALYMDAQVRKVDGVAHAIRAALAFADEAKREEERLAARRKAWTARAERIKEAALYAMQAHGVRVLETATNKLRVQKNGGLVPLEVNIETLPEEYLNITVTIPLSRWRGLNDLAAGTDDYAGLSSDNARIRAALAQQVTCPECNGGGQALRCAHGEDINGETASLDTCPRCEGKGSVPQNIPGAKLGERGVHLRVE